MNDAATVILRPGTPADAAGLSACVRAVARERRWLGTTEGFDPERTRGFITDLLAGGGVQMLALDGSTVIGWCDIFRLAPPGTGHVGRLGMGLLPPWRGLGLGRRLLAACMDAAHAAGIRRVELEVFPHNSAAIALYERYGFVREGCRRAAWLLGDRLEDAVIYAHLRDGADT